jgi:hypothetical protein
MTIPADAVKWATDRFKDTERATDYATYAAYYDGDQSLRFASAKLAASLRGIFDALTYNRCAPVVDAIADRIHLTGFVDPGGASVTAANNLWAENRMDKREGEINAEALTEGDGYAIVWPSVVTGRPTIWPEEAKNVRVLWDDEQPGLIVMAVKYWIDSNGYGRLNLYLPDRLEKYITAQKQQGTPNANGFERYQPDTDLTWPLRYAWFREGAQNVPVFHFGNNARTGRYGRSELKDVIPLQDGLNATLAKLMAASEDAGSPRIAITGWTPRKNEVTGQFEDPFKVVRKPWETVDDKIGAFPNAETTVSQLPTIDLTQLIALSAAFDLMVARVSRIPVHYLGLTADFPSGEALKTAEAPFVRKVEDRQTAFGNVWEDAMNLALRQTGMNLTFQLDARYEPAEPRSDKEQADLAVQYGLAGMPLAAILRLALGLDEDEVAKVLAEADALVPMVADQIANGELTGEDETAMTA